MHYTDFPRRRFFLNELGRERKKIETRKLQVFVDLNEVDVIEW